MTRGILFLLFFAGLHVAVSSAQESFTAGRSFAVCFMNNEDLDKPNALFRLFMIGSRSATGTARWGNEQVQFAVEPGKVTTVDIPLWLALTRPGVVENKGILIECSDTVVVYGLNHASATSDAFLGYPISTLDSDYVILSWPAFVQKNYSGQEPPSQFAIVGAYDDTEVEIRPSDYIWNYRPDTVIKVRLNKGESYLVTSHTFQKYDLTGSTIHSSKPIAVFAGHKRAIVPQFNYDFQNHDHLVEQMLPVSRWDSAVVITPHPSPSRPADRNMFRVVAAFDSTILQVNGVERARLQKGDFFQDTIRGASFISANNPIMAAQYEMSSRFMYEGSPVDRVGDPFMVLAPPISQFLPHYAFLSLPFNAFNSHYFTIITKNGVANDFELDGIPLPDTLQFRAVSNSKYSYAIYQLEEGGHTIRSISSTPFGLMVYGYGKVDSYGYLAGMKMNRLLDQFDRIKPVVVGNESFCKSRTYVFQDTGEIISGFSPLGVEANISNGRIESITFSGDSSQVSVTVGTDDPTKENQIFLRYRDRNGNRVDWNESIPPTTFITKRFLQRGTTNLHLSAGALYCDSMIVVNTGQTPILLTRASFQNNEWWSVVPRQLPLPLDVGQQATFMFCVKVGAGNLTDTLILEDSCGQQRAYPVAVERSVLTGNDHCGNELRADIATGSGAEGVLKIFPNPASQDQLTLHLRASSGGQIEIIQATGLKISTLPVPPTSTLTQLFIPLQSFPSGLFFVRFVSPQGTVLTQQPVIVVR